MQHQQQQQQQHQQQQHQQQVLYAPAPSDHQHHHFQSVPFQTSEQHQPQPYPHHHQHQFQHHPTAGHAPQLPTTSAGGVVYVDGAGRHFLVPQGPSVGHAMQHAPPPQLLYSLPGPPQDPHGSFFPPPPQPQPQPPTGAAPAYNFVAQQHQRQQPGVVYVPADYAGKEGNPDQEPRQHSFVLWPPHHQHHHQYAAPQYQQQPQQPQQQQQQQQQHQRPAPMTPARKPLQPPLPPVHALGLKAHCKWIELLPGARRAVGNQPSGGGGGNGGGLPPPGSKVFVGQARHETTAAHIALLFESIARVTPNTIRPAGKGCFITYVDSDDDARRVASALHRRVLHDHGGVWYAESDEGTAALAAYLGSEEAISVMHGGGGGTAVKLPKQTMVVEHQPQQA